MAQTLHSTIEARRDQMFPVLEPTEIDRLARFGERKSYAVAARIFTTGEVAPGAFLILSGRAESSQHRLDRSEPIVTHGPGSFMGELAQLSGRPSLVDAVAVEPVEALVIPPRRLRDLLVEEAELGERIMRALILRRVVLLETGGGGPIVVGSAESGDVLRLEGFLRAKRSSASAAGPGNRSMRTGADRAFPHRAARIADRALPHRRAAA